MTDFKTRNKAIYDLAASGAKHKDLAAEFGVSVSRIHQIVGKQRMIAKRKEKYAATKAKSPENNAKPDNSFTVKVTIPQSDIGAMLTVLAQRNYQFTVSA